ncbi:MAG: ribose transport system ATP-binding protein [Microbacteriaceae bacterium]|nr:ribose transport system ATP-binding protein [Microbacteriaceae bacterium]
MRSAVVSVTPSAPRRDHAGSPALEIRNITKTYPGGTKALRGVTISLRPGVVHGLVGANGAGKSTLIKIIAGAERPTTGELKWFGSSADWRRPADAQSAGVAVVHQQSPVVPAMSVLENVYLGNETARLWKPRARFLEFAALCERVAFAIDPHTIVADLSVGDRQMVSILRALAQNPALILLDEPTASISPAERAGVLAAARTLASSGVAVVFVSHFLNEVMQICDEVSILRDGQLVDAFERDTMSVERMVAGIVGTRLHAVEASRQTHEVGEVVLDVRELRSATMNSAVNLQVRRGEIVGIAGLLGSGRTSLLKAIFGADRRASGEVIVNGQPLAASPQAAVEGGVAFVPEDRMRQGLIGDWEIWRNTSLADSGNLSRRFGLLDVARERELAARAQRDLGIVASSIDTAVKDLSGGNAQKVVFAKWIYKTHHVLLLDEPTAGVDVAGKADLIKLIRELATQGIGILVVLSEFEELLSLADRIVVLRHGAIEGDLGADAVSVAELTASVGGLA